LHIGVCATTLTASLRESYRRMRSLQRVPPAGVLAHEELGTALPQEVGEVSTPDRDATPRDMGTERV